MAHSPPLRQLTPPPQSSPSALAQHSPDGSLSLAALGSTRRGGRRRRGAKEEGERKMDEAALKNNLTRRPLTRSSARLLSQPQPSSNLISNNLVLPSPIMTNASNTPVQLPVINDGGERSAINPNYPTSPKKQNNNLSDTVFVKQPSHSITSPSFASATEGNDFVSLPSREKLSPVPQQYYNIAPPLEMAQESSQLSPRITLSDRQIEGDWFDDISFPSPWNLTGEQESLKASLKDVRNLMPLSSEKQLHSNAKEYAEASMTPDMVAAIQSLGNLLPEDYFTLYKLKTNKEKWDHINYLVANTMSQNKKWKRYAEGEPKRALEDTTIKNKGKKDSRDFTSYDMPDLMEERVIKEIGGPLRSSSPIPKYVQTREMSPQYPTSDFPRGDSFVANNSSLMETLAPQFTLDAADPMQPGKQIDFSARSVEQRPQQQSAIELKQPQAPNFSEPEQQREIVQPMEFESDSPAPAPQLELPPPPPPPPALAAPASQEVQLQQPALPSSTPPPLPPQQALPFAPEQSRQDESAATPSVVAAAPPLDPGLKYGILRPPKLALHSSPPSATSISSSSQLKERKKSDSTTTAFAPSDVLRKRQMETLDKLSRGKRPKKLQSDDKSHKAAIEDLEQSLYGLADIIPMSDSYDWNNFDFDFTKRKKLLKRKWPQQNLDKSADFINPKSVRHKIYEPKPKKPRRSKKKKK